MSTAVRTTTTTPPPPPAPPPRHGGRVVWGGALVALGAIWAAAIAGLSIPWSLLLPLLLVGLGTLLLVVRDQAIAGALVGLGIVVLVLALLAPGVRSFDIVSIGERAEDVVVAADLDTVYELGLGSLTVDARDLDLDARTDGDAAPELAANVGIGELVVLLPPGVEVTGRAAAGIGDVVVLDRQRSGVGPSIDLRDPTTGGPVVTLDLQVGIGSIEVVQEEAR